MVLKNRLDGNILEVMLRYVMFISDDFMNLTTVRRHQILEVQPS